MEKTIKLYYAKLANMGDLLNDLVIRRCFGCEVERCSFLEGEMSAIGSHLAMYTYHGTPLMKLQQMINGVKAPEFMCGAPALSTMTTVRAAFSSGKWSSWPCVGN